MYLLDNLQDSFILLWQQEAFELGQEELIIVEI
jgi:hypothetical protein